MAKIYLACEIVFQSLCLDSINWIINFNLRKLTYDGSVSNQIRFGSSYQSIIIINKDADRFFIFSNEIQPAFMFQFCFALFIY